jgi:hypothetical protein
VAKIDDARGSEWLVALFCTIRVYLSLEIGCMLFDLFCGCADCVEFVFGGNVVMMMSCGVICNQLSILE